eukprot:845106-Prorocentrum_minimum.AAC.1
MGAAHLALGGVRVACQQPKGPRSGGGGGGPPLLRGQKGHQHRDGARLRDISVTLASPDVTLV